MLVFMLRAEILVVVTMLFLGFRTLEFLLEFMLTVVITGLDTTTVVTELRAEQEPLQNSRSPHVTRPAMSFRADIWYF